jgi:hypothetical protein
MSDNLIASDQPLTPDERLILNAILDTLLPASSERGLPSAGDLDFVAHMERRDIDFLRSLPDLVGRFGGDFPALPYAERHTIMTKFSQTEPQAFEGLLFHAYACYYENDRVLIAIGSKGGPPFPSGNTVEAGDLSLLDPVMKGDHHYRSD